MPTMPRSFFIIRLDANPIAKRFSKYIVDLMPPSNKRSGRTGISGSLNGQLAAHLLGGS